MTLCSQNLFSTEKREKKQTLKSSFAKAVGLRFSSLSVHLLSIFQRVRSTLALWSLKEEHSIPLFVIVCSLSLKKKKRPAATSEKSAPLDQSLELLMCGLVEFKTSHNKEEHSLPRVAIGCAALLDTLVCAFRSYPTTPFIPPHPPSSCRHLPTDRESVTARGIQLTSVTVSSVSFALTQRQWVMCLRHKCWRVCAAEKQQTCAESSPTHCLSDGRFLCAQFTFVPAGHAGGDAVVLLAARHPQTVHWEGAEIDALCTL